MNQIDGLLVLAALPLGLLLAGYWLAARMDATGPGERLACAVLAGLAVLLLSVSVVNFFLPLSAPWAWLCLTPALLTLGRPAVLAQLRGDLGAVLLRPLGAGLALGTAVFLGLLLWPLLRHGSYLFYDGTSNHDSFFWITAAEHLKRHPYMVAPVASDVHPLMHSTVVITGWQPTWGRMGAEGLLALASALTTVSPLKLYLYATACLFIPWVAAVYLVVKTFMTGQPARLALLALPLLQPVFIFFYSNANLPNLLGTLTGAGVVLATERGLRAARRDWVQAAPWLALLALSLHGLMCAYPEMLPFVLLPAGLLWLRSLQADRRGGRGSRAGLIVAAAGGLGVALNPATTVRAVNGFMVSFMAARADGIWSNLFAPLAPPEFVPALFTLAVPATRKLGVEAGFGLAILITIVAVGTIWRARDRVGSLLIFSGGLALAVYTLATGFHYGWQKTVQFTGVFCAALVPVGALDLLARAGRTRGWRRAAAATGLGALACYLGFSSIMNALEIQKWSGRKLLSDDWYALRDLSRGELFDAPVLIDGASFRMAFFHSMWAVYFLSDSRTYFAARGHDDGGYLRSAVVTEKTGRVPRPAANLVGREWADAFDANSPRLLVGREFALVPHANRIKNLQGVYPLNGLPEYAAPKFSLTVRPGTDASLAFDLAPHQSYKEKFPAGAWNVARGTGNTPEFTATVGGPPPWHIRVPLRSQQEQQVSLEFVPAAASGETYPFVMTNIRLASDPVRLAPGGGIRFSAGGNWEPYHLTGLTPALHGFAAAAGPEAELQFQPDRATGDIELQLVAEPRFAAGQPPELLTELWFNQTKLFSGTFTEPGVLRARILRDIWNEFATARISLRFPRKNGRPGETALVLKELSVQPAGPRP